MSHTRYHLRYPAMYLRLSRVSPMPVIAAMNNYSWSAFIRGRWAIDLEGPTWLHIIGLIDKVLTVATSDFYQETSKS